MDELEPTAADLEAAGRWPHPRLRDNESCVWTRADLTDAFLAGILRERERAAQVAEEHAARHVATAIRQGGSE